MKKLILCTALLAGAAGKLCAQPAALSSYYALSPTEKMFNILPWVDIKDILHLEAGTMTFELRDINDYKSLMGLDTILQKFRQDIAFYRDSLENGAGNVRIDYATHLDKEQRELRFTKYHHKGDPFVIRNGETERLKIERDTIRILVNGVRYKEDMAGYRTEGKKKIKMPRAVMVYPVQVTIVLNNYSDIGRITTDWPVVRHAMDTFVAVRTSKEAARPSFHPTTCTFRPYSTNWFRFSKTSMADHDNRLAPDHTDSRGRVTFFCNIGAGLIRNTVLPLADAGIALNKYHRWGNRSFTILSATPVFFFQKDDKDFYIHDNWFVNLERGDTYMDGVMGLSVQAYSWGVGYLAIPRGDYFSGVTMKVFANTWFKSGVIMTPEIIATNTFRKFFPGLSVKIPVVRS